MKEITNKDQEKAFIISLKENEGISITDFTRLIQNKPCRVFFWIDNEEGSLNEAVESKFKCIFDEHKIDSESFCAGRPFSMNNFECKDILTFCDKKENFLNEITVPRAGQDGGVIK